MKKQKKKRRRYDRRRLVDIIEILFRNEKPDYSNECQYSKRILGRMINLWFTGAKFGFCVIIALFFVSPESVAPALESLLVYIGGPILGGIVSYMIKSALEGDKPKKRKSRKAAADAAETEKPEENI